MYFLIHRIYLFTSEKSNSFLNIILFCDKLRKYWNVKIARMAKFIYLHKISLLIQYQYNKIIFLIHSRFFKLISEF